MYNYGVCLERSSGYENSHESHYINTYYVSDEFSVNCEQIWDCHGQCALCATLFERALQDFYGRSSSVKSVSQSSPRDFSGPLIRPASSYSCAVVWHHLPGHYLGPFGTRMVLIDADERQVCVKGMFLFACVLVVLSRQACSNIEAAWVLLSLQSHLLHAHLATKNRLRLSNCS